MEIRRIKKSEWDKLRDFNAREYSPNHILANKKYYDWQFDNFANPNRDSYETLGLFGKNGQILGTFGCFSAPYNFYGKTVQGNCLCNLIVKKELRSLGYGYLLLAEASKLGDIAIDHNINETAWPLFMKAGWEGDKLNRYIFIINPKSSFYALPGSRGGNAVLNGASFAEIEKFDELFDGFWQKIKNRYPISIERSSRYLNWRYTKNPFVKYRQFAVKENSEIKAVVILRIEEPKNEFGPTGERVGRIVDFVASSGAESYALSETIKFCQNNKIDFIDFFESADFHTNSFLSCGFADGNIAPFDSLPILFNPVSLKRTHLNFAVKKISEAKLGDWFTTKGGGDMDRPW